MSTRTRRMRRLTVAVAGLAAAGALAAPAVAAHAATRGYTPSPHEWWFNSWHIQQEVWPVSEGAGVTVGLVDSGVQANIPDLQGVVQPGGDMLGYSTSGEQDYESNGGHGTAMAALIAGQGNGIGPVGIAPKVKILPVHAIDPSSSMTPVAQGIKYAVDHGASVINLSVGFNAPSATSCDPQLQSAVSYALARNAVVVAASGDTNKGGSGPEEPGTCAGVLAVGGVEPNGSLWQYSTQGPYVSVAAPGDHLFIVNSNGQQYSVTASGTSSSSALVSAAAALIRAKNPSMPWYKVDQQLIGTALPDGPQPNNGTGYGIIDIAKALTTTVPASAPNPPYARYQAYLKSIGQSSGSSGHGPGAQPSATAKSAKGSGTLIIVLVVVIVLLIVAALIIVMVTRGRSRRGPRNPGGGGYPPGGYGPPGQYPPAPQGQYPPPGQQYPPPR